MTQRAGFIAIVGEPNAGKSTLINALVGSKVTIVSSKVQTTRRQVLGITIEGDSQLIFVDTPGLFTPQKRLEKAMVKAAWSASQTSDLTLLLIDASKKDLSQSLEILKKLEETSKHILIAFNKIDKIDKKSLLPLMTSFDFPFVKASFMISALKLDGLNELKNYLSKNVPQGPWLYPIDQLSDLPERIFASEITLEKVFHALFHELPYAITVETDSWEDFRNGSVKIVQTLYVQRESHKGIVLGEKGTTLKKIGESSRIELEKLLERKVHLFLFVKVQKNWQENPERYENLGLEFK